MSGARTIESATLPGAWRTLDYPHDTIAIAERQAIGTTARLVTSDPASLPHAAAIVDVVLGQLDQAASRFRPDSDLQRVNRIGGGAVVLGRRLRDLVATALEAARFTEGRVDPTIGAALIAAGYDRDFAELAARGARTVRSAPVVPGWRSVELRGELFTFPVGTVFDLGATAKAYGADRAAELAAAATGAGVLVSFGGDLACGGSPPEGGWPVSLEEAESASPPVAVTELRLLGGGLATSSTTRRRWRHGDQQAHHVIDPRTAAPAVGSIRTATVAAASCAEANAASTAVIVGDDAALAWLLETGLPARLVTEEGEIMTVGTWPPVDHVSLPLVTQPVFAREVTPGAWGPAR